VFEYSELWANNEVVCAKVIPLLSRKMSSDFQDTFLIPVGHEMGVPEDEAEIITVMSTSLNLIWR
jgi:hypothetical protein